MAQPTIYVRVNGNCIKVPKYPTAETVLRESGLDPDEWQLRHKDTGWAYDPDDIVFKPAGPFVATRPEN